MKYLLFDYSLFLNSFRFLKNFKKNREELANRLYAFYNEIVFDNKVLSACQFPLTEVHTHEVGTCILFCLCLFVASQGFESSME